LKKKYIEIKEDLQQAQQRLQEEDRGKLDLLVEATEVKKSSEKTS